MTGTAPRGRRRATSAASELPAPIEPPRPPEVNEPAGASGAAGSAVRVEPPGPPRLQEPAGAPGDAGASASTGVSGPTDVQDPAGVPGQAEASGPAVPPQSSKVPAEDRASGEGHTAERSERLASLLADHVPPQAPDPSEPSAPGPAHRWEVAARTRVPRSFLLLALAGLTVLAWVLFGPVVSSGRGQGPESGAGDVLAEVEVAGTPEASAPAAPGFPAATQSAGAPVLVHVTGEVAEPGVVELDPGARVLDAVEAAGGLTDAAVTGTVNLAAPVTDGQQVLVPDAEAAEAAAPVPPARAGTVAGTAAGAPQGPLNLNTATAADLEVLPRVGPVLAQRIVEFRDAQGGFAAVAHLDAVPGIGPVLMETLAPLVTV